MCDDEASSLVKPLQTLVARVPKIVVQRAEEIFRAVNEIEVSVLYFRSIFRKQFCGYVTLNFMGSEV
jgi:hypothetical protein